jgi:hypothetical protein
VLTAVLVQATAASLLAAQDAEAQDFLREAEALLAKPKTPGDK